MLKVSPPMRPADHRVSADSPPSLCPSGHRKPVKTDQTIGHQPLRRPTTQRFIRFPVPARSAQIPIPTAPPSPTNHRCTPRANPTPVENHSPRLRWAPEGASRGATRGASGFPPTFTPLTRQTSADSPQSPCRIGSQESSPTSKPTSLNIHFLHPAIHHEATVTMAEIGEICQPCPRSQHRNPIILCPLITGMTNRRVSGEKPANQKGRPAKPQPHNPKLPPTPHPHPSRSTNQPPQPPTSTQRRNNDGSATTVNGITRSATSPECSSVSVIFSTYEPVFSVGGMSIRRTTKKSRRSRRDASRIRSAGKWYTNGSPDSG